MTEDPDWKKAAITIDKQARKIEKLQKRANKLEDDYVYFATLLRRVQFERDEAVKKNKIAAVDGLKLAAETCAKARRGDNSDWDAALIQVEQAIRSYFENA
jgi:hypothetical protein